MSDVLTNYYVYRKMDGTYAMCSENDDVQIDEVIFVGLKPNAYDYLLEIQETQDVLRKRFI